MESTEAKKKKTTHTKIEGRIFLEPNGNIGYTIYSVHFGLFCEQTKYSGVIVKLDQLDELDELDALFGFKLNKEWNIIPKISWSKHTFLFLRSSSMYVSHSPFFERFSLFFFCRKYHSEFTIYPARAHTNVTSSCVLTVLAIKKLNTSVCEIPFLSICCPECSAPAIFCSRFFNRFSIKLSS